MKPNKNAQAEELYKKLTSLGMRLRVDGHWIVVSPTKLYTYDLMMQVGEVSEELVAVIKREDTIG